jgi:rhamnose utilization protein RhaD (predicted bifunctional aldolase and dehydrogenase)/NAD(P)-dependent dehydrogenase (short-subunit alcohol dehydrogenase family)
MQSRYDAAEAKRACERLVDHGEAIALRIYAAELVARDERLGGSGSTASLKRRFADRLGEELELLHIVSADDDRRPIEPGALAVYRHASLARAALSEALSEAEAAEHVARQRFGGSSSPTGQPPLGQVLLHAFVPAPAVDFAPAVPVLQLLAGPNPEGAVAAIFGDDALFVHYATEGARLAVMVATAWRDHQARRGAPPSLLLLERLGVVTWGDSAEESYARLVAAVGRAHEATHGRIEPMSVADQRTEEFDEARRVVSLAVRGALMRASDRRWFTHWKASGHLARLSLRQDLFSVARVGVALPADCDKTRAYPLVLGDQAGGNPETLAAILDEALAAYRTEYAGPAQSERDRLPRVVIVPDFGVLSVGESLREARLTGELFARNVEVIDGADSLGGYRPLDERSLYQAIHAAPAPVAARPLEGLAALVTGAGSGIGLATSRAMLAAGAHVMITDRDERVLEAVCEWPELRFPGRFVALACDVTSERDCERVVAATCDAFGGIDILVSNAGNAPSGLLHTESGEAALRASLDVNFLAHQHTARAAAQAMLTQGAGGVLLFNASKTAFHQGPDFGPYAVAKAALVSLMRQYAIDLGRHGIRANAVNADRIRTNLFAPATTVPPSADRDISPSEYFKNNLLCRETSSTHVADAFVYLATAGATTGCVITVDGGNPAAFPR